MVAALVVGFGAARRWTRPPATLEQPTARAGGPVPPADRTGGGERARARPQLPRLALSIPTPARSEWDAYVRSDPERHVGQSSEIILALVRAGDQWVPGYAACASLLTGEQAQDRLRLELQVALTADAIEIESGRILSTESGAALDARARRCLDGALPRRLRIERDRPAEIAAYRGPFEILSPSTF